MWEFYIVFINLPVEFTLFHKSKHRIRVFGNDIQAIFRFIRGRKCSFIDRDIFGMEVKIFCCISLPIILQESRFRAIFYLKDICFLSHFLL